MMILAAALCLFVGTEARLTDKWDFIYKHCPKHVCTHEDHTILDWNENEGCHCRLHPCHYDDGNGKYEAKKHSCPDPKFPYLEFSYNKEKELECMCKEHPCPDRKCGDASHSIAWTHDGECYCRSPEEREL